MTTFYNDNEEYVVQWLRNLMAAGLISEGAIDGRSISAIQPGELKQFNRCHFFAGIGGWEYALQLAGWPDEWPVWSGSCPCQPFSVAGKRKGEADERHLWPVWYELIKQCHPPVLFGEQVESKDGREWLAGVFIDLEKLGYAVAGADLCAAGIGAPHIRQRLYWVAYAQHSQRGSKFQEDGDTYGRDGSGRSSESGRMGDSKRARSQGRGVNTGEHADQLSAWSPSELIACADGKARRTQPGIFPLASGVSARVGKLRAYGNAIVPQVAAEFIRAFLDTLSL